MHLRPRLRRHLLPERPAAASTPTRSSASTRTCDKFLPHLRPEARELVEQEGFLSSRTKGGLPMLRVVDGWCVFFNEGCVLHKVGAAEGDKYRYKPAPCARSRWPPTRTTWYVRQWGYEGEDWDVFCLNPQASPVPAAESLADEIALAARYTAEEEAARPQGPGGRA